MQYFEVEIPLVYILIIEFSSSSTSNISTQPVSNKVEKLYCDLKDSQEMNLYLRKNITEAYNIQDQLEERLKKHECLNKTYKNLVNFQKKIIESNETS